MAYREISGQEKLGKIWMPEARISYPGRGGVKLQYGALLCATIDRTRICQQTVQQSRFGDESYDYVNPLEYDPALDARDLVYASVSHNGRINDGASIQMNRCFGALSGTLTAATTFTFVASGGAGAGAGSATANVTITATDSSLGTNTAFLTTNEYIAASGAGLQRAAATAVETFVAASTEDGTCSGNVRENFLPTQTRAVYTSGLFDAAATASGNMYCEANFTEGVANVVSGDTLIVTWTITF